jgi:hypothetical protein
VTSNMLVTALVCLSPVVAIADDLAKQPKPKDKQSLLQRLETDYQQLLAAEPNPEPVRQAARLLAETNVRWTNHNKALTLLRKHRSKAGIPLLLKYAVLHTSVGNTHMIVPRYFETLSALVGEKFECPEARGPERQETIEKTVLKLYVDWWLPNKATVITDPGKMSEGQIQLMVDEVLERGQRWLEAETHRRRGELVSAEALYSAVSATLREREGPHGVSKDELHGRMTPVLLRLAGYVEKPAADPTRGPTEVLHTSIPLLALLRQKGEAPQLDAIAADTKQNNATRLTCLHALHLAGDDLNVPTLLAIYDKDTRLECRVLALLLAGISRTHAAAVPKLVEALGDKNREIRVAAIHGLQSSAPAEALPKLCKIVRDREPPELVSPAIRLLGRIGGDEAAAALVDWMEEVLRVSGRDRDLNNALDAFSAATRTRWLEAVPGARGARDPDFYAKSAQKAIEWWKSQRK